MFQNTTVARHQVRRKHTGGLIQWEVPRLDRIDDADRLIAHDPAFAVGTVGALFIRKHVGAILGGILKDGRANLYLGLAIFQQLTCLARHKSG